MPIDKIGTLRRLVASVLGITTDTTTIAADVAGLDGDAMRGTNDALLAASYVTERGTDNAALAVNYTAARAGYLDELAAANIPSDVDDLLSNLALNYHQSHARTRVYPQEPSSVIQIATAAVVDTFGSWTQVVPIDTIDFDYTVLKVMIEESGAAATYIGQLGYSLIDGTDPTTAQIIGEQRFKVIGTPIKNFYSDLTLLGGHTPANAKLWGRLKSSTANADTVDISIVFTKLTEITNPVTPVATWPYAT